MIVVKIELWPQGRPTHAREIGRAFFTNISKDKDNIYQVRVDAESAPHLDIQSISDDFVLEGHSRESNVLSLIGRAFGKFVTS